MDIRKGKTPLESVVNKVISNIKKKEKEELDIVGAWREAAGNKAFKHAKPAFMKAKRLIINVSNSSWLYQLTLVKENLIKKFNESKKTKKKIKEIQFRIGQV